MAANHISTEKVVGSFFNRASRSADISGNVPSDHSVTQKGRRGRRTTDKVKIQDDFQFTGRAYQVSTADASCIKGSVSFGVGNGEVGTLSIWFKLNSMNDGVIFHGVYDYVKLAGSGTQIKIAGNSSSGGTPALFDIPAVQINQWYHLVVFLDGVNDEAKVWLNSVESTSATQSIIPELSSLLRIGIYNTISSINLDGYIAHVGRWSRELTQQEVEDLYQFKIPTSQVDFYLPLEQANDEALVPSVVSTANPFTTENFVSGDWVEDSEFPYSWLNDKGYNSYYEWNGSRFVRLNTGWELANDWKIILRDVYVYPKITSNLTLFSLNGSYYTYIDVYTNGELQVGIVTSEGPTNIPIANTDLFDGKSHTIEVIKSSTGDGSGNGVKVIFDGVDLGWIQAIADTTLDNVSESTRTAIGHYFADSQQNHIGTLGDVEYYDINDNLIKKFTASAGYKDQSGTPPLSSSLPTFTSVPASISASEKDIFDKVLEFRGRLAPRIQLVNAPCVVLNGTDQSISLPGETQVSTDQGTTFWFKVKIDPGSGDYTVFGSGDLSLFRWSTTDTTIRLRGHTNSAESIMTFPQSIRTGEWQDVVLIRRVSDSKFTCYINGVQNTEGYISVNSGNSFRIDSLGEGSTRWTNGEISLFGKWFRSFSLAEIQALSTQLPSIDSVEDLYVFSEGNGSTVYDISGNNKHATIVNAVLPDVWGTQELFHYSFYHGYYNFTNTLFDSGEKIIYGDIIDFANLGEFTFVAVIKTQATTGSFLSKYKTSPTADRSFLVSINADGSLRGTVSSDGDVSTTSVIDVHGDEVINDGDWHLIAVVFDGNQPVNHKLKLYVDGSLNVNTVVLNRNANISTVHNSTVDIISGASRLGSESYEAEFDNSCNISFLGFSSQALSSNQISGFLDQDYDLKLYKDLTTQGVAIGELLKEQEYIPVSDLFEKDKGFYETGMYNGASDIRFPEIPQMPADLRGNTFTQKEVEGLVYAGRILSSDKDLVLFREKVESVHFQRKGSGLILDDYPATCPSTALQKIHSDFVGNILTVRNEDNLQDASFGFDKYGRLPEADIIDHLNGTANGRVTSYNFQDVNHAGVGYTQTVLADMPYIAKNGVIQKDSRELPALRFDGAESMTYESQTAFKPMHDGSRGVQLIGFQVDEGQSDFWVVGNTDFQGQVGFEFFGDVFNLDKAHFIVRTNTSNSAISDLNIPILMGEYNRMVNYIDPSNPQAIERHIVLINELERAANIYTELPDTGNTEDGTTSVGALGVRKMEGYVNELIFMGDHKTDLLKLSRSLMFMP